MLIFTFDEPVEHCFLKNFSPKLVKWRPVTSTLNQGQRHFQTPGVVFFSLGKIGDLHWQESIDQLKNTLKM